MSYLALCVHMQTWIVKEYNEVVITVTIASFFLVMMSTIIALFAERNNPRAWILRPDMELAAILYSVRIYNKTIFNFRLHIHFNLTCTEYQIYNLGGMVIYSLFSLCNYIYSISYYSLIYDSCIIYIGPCCGNNEKHGQYICMQKEGTCIRGYVYSFWNGHCTSHGTFIPRRIFFSCKVHACVVCNVYIY